MILVVPFLKSFNKSYIIFVLSKSGNTNIPSDMAPKLVSFEKIGHCLSPEHVIGPIKNKGDGLCNVGTLHKLR